MADTHVTIQVTNDGMTSSDEALTTVILIILMQPSI
jgi:hypothetical protein